MIVSLVCLCAERIDVVRFNVLCLHLFSVCCVGGAELSSTEMSWRLVAVFLSIVV